MESLTKRFGRLTVTKQKKPRKYFGYYKCSKCKREWQSAHSWEGYKQACKKCGNEEFALSREELVKSKENKIDLKIAHAQNLCEMCKKLGRLCTDKSSAYFPDYYDSHDFHDYDD